MEEPPPPPPPARVTVQKDRLVLDGKVYFDTGKDSIKSESMSLLDEVAAALEEHSEVERVVVEGHTDSTGSAKLNQGLSQRRAAAVKSYLVGKGVAADRIDSQGFGGSRPVDSNKTAKGREMNRRVEFLVK